LLPAHDTCAHVLVNGNVFKSIFAWLLGFDAVDTFPHGDFHRLLRSNGGGVAACISFGTFASNVVIIASNKSSYQFLSFVVLANQNFKPVADFHTISHSLSDIAPNVPHFDLISMKFFNVNLLTN
jgi:hypothetical protein